MVTRLLDATVPLGVVLLVLLLGFLVYIGIVLTKFYRQQARRRTW